MNILSRKIKIGTMMIELNEVNISREEFYIYIYIENLFNYKKWKPRIRIQYPFVT